MEDSPYEIRQNLKGQQKIALKNKGRNTKDAQGNGFIFCDTLMLNI